MAKELKKQGIISIVLLMIFTLGIYGLYYIWKMKEISDGLGTAKKVENNFFYSYVGAIVLSVALPMSGIDVGFINSLLSLATMILYIVLSFQLKDVLTEYFNAKLKRNVEMSGFWTFVFGFLYLQHKINQQFEVASLTPAKGKA